MTLTPLANDALIDCIIAREKACRFHFSSYNTRKKHPSSSTGEHAGDDPNSAPFSKFEKFKGYIDGLHHSSTQLSPTHLYHFESEYPSGSQDTTLVAAENAKEHRKYHHNRDENASYLCGYDSWDDGKRKNKKTPPKFNGYEPKRDAASLINQIDLALLKTSKDADCKNANIVVDVIQKNHDQGVIRPHEYIGIITTRSNHEDCSDEKSHNSSVTKIPSLQSLAQDELQTELLRNGYKEEQILVNKLQKLVQTSNDKLHAAIERHQKRFEKSEEAREVVRIRRLLHEAEEKLKEKQREIVGDVVKEREVTQAEFDRERANLAINYIKKRDEAMEIHPGISLCQNCMKRFDPTPREALPGWGRCSVAGCSSGEKLCIDCSSVPCRRCHAPICAVHFNSHNIVCELNCEELCGYDTKKKKMALDRGCCGLPQTPLNTCECGVQCCSSCQGSGWSWCKPCADLRDRQLGSPTSSDFDSDGEPKRAQAPVQPLGKYPGKIKWSGAEYERERKRKKTLIRNRSVSTGKQPPFEYSLKSSEKWKKEQDIIHQNWIKERLDNPSKQEYEWVDGYYERLVDDLSYQDPWFGKHHEEMMFDSLREAGHRGFSEWIKSNRVEKKVEKIFTEYYIDAITDEQRIPPTICPCGICKQNDTRVEFELKSGQRT